MESNKNINNIDFENINSKEDYIDIKEIVFLLISNSKLVLSIIMISLFLGFLVAIMSTPLHKSSGTILVENNSSTFSLFENFNSGSGSNSIDNEVEILKSKQTMRKTIDRFIDEGLNSDMFIFRTKKYDYKPVQNFFGSTLEQ